MSEPMSPEAINFIEKWAASLRVAAVAMDPRNCSEKTRLGLVEEFEADAKAAIERAVAEEREAIAADEESECEHPPSPGCCRAHRRAAAIRARGKA